MKIMIKSIAIIASLAVTTLALFGMQMPTDGHGMEHCPLMADQSVVCDMAPLTHLELWQGLFQIVVETGIVMFLFVAIAWICNETGFFVHDVFQHFRQWHKLLVEYHFHSYFSWLFSDGILHPKNA